MQIYVYNPGKADVYIGKFKLNAQSYSMVPSADVPMLKESCPELSVEGDPNFIPFWAVMEKPFEGQLANPETLYNNQGGTPC
jgi:hypothetical protein